MPVICPPDNPFDPDDSGVGSSPACDPGAVASSVGGCTPSKIVPFVAFPSGAGDSLDGSGVGGVAGGGAGGGEGGCTVGGNMGAKGGGRGGGVDGAISGGGNVNGGGVIGA